MSHPPPLNDEEAGASGKKPGWVAGWADWTAAEMRDSFAKIQEAPPKECDVLRGCTEPTVWAVRLHGCAFYVACEGHCQFIAGLVMTPLFQAGFFGCDECREFFTLQPEVVRFWPI